MKPTREEMAASLTETLLERNKLAGENRRLREALQELFSATKVLYFSETFQRWDKQLSPVHDAVVTAAMKTEKVLSGEPDPPASACPKCGTKMIWREPHVLKTYGNWKCIVCVPPSAVSPQDRGKQ